MNKISIVVPCYNEEEALEYFYAEIKKVMEKMQEVCFEILFVDDGSVDQTLIKLRKLAELDPRCRYLSFSRNFGKEAAIYAGLSYASGDYGDVQEALPGELGLCSCPPKRPSGRTETEILSVRLFL